MMQIPPSQLLFQSSPHMLRSQPRDTVLRRPFPRQYLQRSLRLSKGTTAASTSPLFDDQGWTKNEILVTVIQRRHHNSISKNGTEGNSVHSLYTGDVLTCYLSPGFLIMLGSESERYDTPVMERDEKEGLL